MFVKILLGKKLHLASWLLTQANFFYFDSTSGSTELRDENAEYR